MTPYRIIIGDVRASLALLPERSVQLCMTSPPYWSLRSYLPADHASKALEMGSEPSPDAYVAGQVAVFAAVRQVLRDDGVLVVNYGDSYASGGGALRDGEGKVAGRAANRNGCPVPVGLKPKDLCGIPWRVALALQADGWYLRSALPWVKRCLSGGAVVYVRTQKGDMPMMVKDLVRLDPSTVKLWNGTKWTQALGWWEPSEQEERVEIELASGERIGSTTSHRWPTARGLVTTSDLVHGDVLDTCRLPEPDAPTTPASLPDDSIGWLCGFYLAEGHATGDAVLGFSTHAKETSAHRRIAEIAAAFGDSSTSRMREGHGATCGTYGRVLPAIVRTYISGNHCRVKCLTTKCWQRSNAFLDMLLRGYLEGDGHYDTKNRRWRIGFTQNDAMARDLRVLCARLGHSITLRRCQHTIGEKKYPGWRGTIRLRIDATVKVPGGFAARVDSKVVAIRPSRCRKVWDIAVADEPHLFALASGVLTHNSAMPESVTDRPASAVEYVFLLSKSERYFWDAEAVRTAAITSEWPGIGPGHAGARDRGEKYEPMRTRGWAGSSFTDDRDLAVHPSKGMGERNERPGRNFRNADLWFQSVKGPHGLCGVDDELVGLDVTAEPSREEHFAAYPSRLVEPFVKAGTSERGCCPACGAGWGRIKAPTGATAEAQAAARNGHDWYARATDNAHKRPNGKKTGDKAASGYVSEYRTLGWSPACDCHTLACPTCTVVELVHDQHDTRLERTAVEVRSVPDDLLRTQMEGATPVLQQGVSRAMAGEEPKHDDRMVQRHSGVHTHLQAGASDGHQGRICDGTPAGDGPVVEEVATSRRSGASQEREEIGQSPEKPGTNDQADTRPSTKAQGRNHRVSTLRSKNQSVPSCQACGTRLVKVAHKPIPCLVLDPFSGTGTTGAVACRLGRRYIGCELFEKYAAISERRIERAIKPQTARSNEGTSELFGATA